MEFRVKVPRVRRNHVKSLVIHVTQHCPAAQLPLLVDELESPRFRRTRHKVVTKRHRHNAQGVAVHPRVEAVRPCIGLAGAIGNKRQVDIFIFLLRNVD